MTHQDLATFSRQGFGQRLSIARDIGVLFIDFAVAFVDPEQLGGGNIQEATNVSAGLLACARRCNGELVRPPLLCFNSAILNNKLLMCL